MIASVLLLAALAGAQAAPEIDPEAGPEKLYVTGTAHAADGGEHVYTEYHYCTEDRLVCTVQYRDPQQVLIASKTIDYRQSLVAPAVQLRDTRSDRQYELTPGEGGEIVVDAGFDNYVRRRWEALAAGETVKFRFHVLSLDRALSMRAEQVDEPDCRAQTLCLRVEVDSWLLGLLADPIDLTYERASRRLLAFRGVSNLKSKAGDSQRVEIRYQYAEPVALLR